MNKAISIIIVIGMLLMVAIPVVEAVQTETVYVGITGKIAGYCTFDYGGQRYGDYIVWTRALDIYDSSGNVNPDGDVLTSGGFRDPSWIMIQQISTGEQWNITPDYDAGLRLSPNYYYHADAVSIYGDHVIYEWAYGDDNWERTLYMYNITTEETWQIPHGFLSGYTCGYTHMIYGDWIYFTHYGGGRYIYIYNYKSGEGRRVDAGLTSNSNLGINNDFVWFTNSGTTPRPLILIGLETGKWITIEHDSANVYASLKTSTDGRKLGVCIDDGDWDSYIIDLEGANITAEGSDQTLNWDDIQEHIIPVDTENSYNSYAPIVEGNNAVYPVNIGGQYDIQIYKINEERMIYFASSDNDEKLSDFSGTMIIYHTNINSFTHNNDESDDYDIYRSISDTENIGNTITNAVPFILIIMIVGVILGAFKLFGESGGSGGLI